MSGVKKLIVRKKQNVHISSKCVQFAILRLCMASQFIFLFPPYAKGLAPALHADTKRKVPCQIFSVLPPFLPKTYFHRILRKYAIAVHFFQQHLRPIFITASFRLKRKDRVSFRHYQANALIVFKYVEQTHQVFAAPKKMVKDVSPPLIPMLICRRFLRGHGLYSHIGQVLAPSESGMAAHPSPGLAELYSGSGTAASLQTVSLPAFFCIRTHKTVKRIWNLIQTGNDI